MRTKFWRCTCCDSKCAPPTTHLQCDVFGRGGKVDPGATGPALHNSVEVRCSPDTETAHDTQGAVGGGRSCRGGNDFRLASVCEIKYKEGPNEEKSARGTEEGGHPSKKHGASKKGF